MRTPGGLTLRTVALAATLGLASSPSPADPVAPSARPKFGTNVATSTVSAYDFSPIDSTTLFDHPVIQGTSSSPPRPPTAHSLRHRSFRGERCSRE